MHADKQNPDTPPPAEELTGNLKRAVDEVRGQKPPDGSAAWSVYRAACIDGTRVRRRGLVGVLAGGIAATFFVGLCLWTFSDEIDGKAGDSYARAEISGLSNSMKAFDRDYGDLGNDPDVPLNYNVDRRADASVPGVALPEEPHRGPRRGLEELKKIIREQDIERGLIDPSRRGNMGQLAPEEAGRVRVPGLRDPVNVEDLRQIGLIVREGKDGKPQNDSFGGNGSGPGNVDPKKLKKLAEDWGKLAERDRAKELADMTRDMPPRYREIIEIYFRKLGGEKSPDKSPQIWKPQARPTFARVHLGDGNSLELVSLHVTVTVEGPRARTLVDHVFRNPHDRQLEGAFEYPLPTGASPSYFAMFLGQTRGTMPPLFAARGDAPPLPQDMLARLTPDQLVKQVSAADWGKLQEARVVSKDKALETYEEVTRRRIDPALLEYASGNTFRGRVFPIPAKGYNRILIAYEEQLPFVGDQVRYRFPLPDCKLSEMQFTLSASTAQCKDATFKASGGASAPR